MLRIYPYKPGSKSAKKLKESIGGKIIKLENSRYRYRPQHKVINWGNSRRPSWMSTDIPVLNSPEAVHNAANKLVSFRILRDLEVPHVPFTDNYEEAQAWVDLGEKVFVRHTLAGHSGEGIEIVNGGPFSTELDAIASRLWELGYEYLAEQVSQEIQPPKLPQALLYTRAVPNNGEYRVHVFNGEVILYQKKSRRVDEDGNVLTPEGEEADVRNLASNWVYRTSNLRRLERVEQLAVSAISAIGLDFGAVDIIKDENGDVFILEINSAPGLGNNDTLVAYREAVSSWMLNQ